MPYVSCYAQREQSVAACCMQRKKGCVDTDLMIVLKIGIKVYLSGNGSMGYAFILLETFQFSANVPSALYYTISLTPSGRYSAHRGLSCGS